MSSSDIATDALDLVFQTNDGPVHALSDITLESENGELSLLIGLAPAISDWLQGALIMGEYC